MTPRRLGLAAWTAILGLTLTAAAALAHVGVASPNATAGQPAVLTFYVPNELTGHSTTGLEVYFPTDPRLTGVSSEPPSGWRADVTTRTDGSVASVRWTGGRLTGKDSGQFTVRIAKLPDVALLELPTDQTYDDGNVVRWEGADVPKLAILPAGSAPTTTSSTIPPTITTTSGAAISIVPNSVPEPQKDGDGSFDLAWVLLVVSALATGLAILVLVRGRRAR
jgi:uncharacterized protein YcnI